MKLGADAKPVSPPPQAQPPKSSSAARFREPALPRVIGHGAAGTVTEAYDAESGRLVAVKRVALAALSERAASALVAEVSVMKRLRHPNIVQYIGARRDPSGHSLAIYMELVAGGSLAAVIARYGALPEHACRRHIADAVRGLRYLHRLGVAHRDIKCENLLLDSAGKVKVADFGACKALGNGFKAQTDATAGVAGGNAETVANALAWTLAGTPLFIPPEVVLGAGYDPMMADIWCVGVCALQLVTGKPPFPQLVGKPPLQYLMLIGREGVLPLLPVAPAVSPECASFLAACVVREPAARPPIGTLAQHPWIADLVPDDEEGTQSDRDSTPVRSPEASATAPRGPFLPA